jgi:hypothetical protein
MTNKFLHIILFVLALFLLNLQVIAQYESFKNPKITDKSTYISSGEDQTVYLKGKKTIKINIVFYPKLIYKVDIVPVNPKLIIVMRLFSAQGENYFTNSDKNYLKFWHFCFQSVTNCTLEIGSITPSKEEEVLIKISHLQNE